MTAKEKILNEHLALYRVRAELPALLGFLSERFNNIKSKGASSSGKSNFKLSPEEEAYVLKEVMKEGVQFYFERKLRSSMLAEAKSISTEHGLVANPSQWPNIFKDIPLNHFDEPAMRWVTQGPNTPQRGVFKTRSWFSRETLGNMNQNLQLLEHESKFERGYVNKMPTSEKYMNFTLKQVPPKDLPALFEVCSVLSSIPFELNSKLKYGFQLSEQFKAVITGKSFEFSKKRDGIPDASNDAGVCLTVLVNADVDPPSQGPTCLLVCHEVSTPDTPTEVPLFPGEMLILRSRYVGEYTLKMLKDKKSSLVVQWVNGPFDRHNRIQAKRKK